MRRLRVTGTAIAIMALAALFSSPTVADARPTSSSYMARGDTLNKGQAIVRSNGGTAAWQLIMQGDGNLVLYYHAWYGTKVCFSTSTQGRGYEAAYNLDGDLTVLDARGFRIWHSGANTGTTVDINSQGRLYVGNDPMNNKCPVYLL
jgi:hypothetical protein